MYVDNWETQAKTTVMAINKHLHVHGIGGRGGGTQAKTTLMSLNKYLHVPGDWGELKLKQR